MDELTKSKYDLLIRNFGFNEALTNILAGAHYLQELGGTPMTEYWQSEKLDLRDEFYIVLNSYFGATQIPRNIPHNNKWREAFDVVFLFPIKATAQSAVSLEILTSRYCYTDAFAVLRAMLSRANILLLCSLNPSLFDLWLKTPKDEKFLDGHIRKELENNGIFTVSHLYEFSSEILHGQAQALFDIGYFNKPGLFTEIQPIRNQVFVIAKYILAITTYSMIQMAILDFGTKKIPDDLTQFNELYKKFISTILIPNRFEHIWTLTAEERHWEKAGKNKYNVGGLYNFEKYSEILGKFHKDSGQKKKLSKKYNV